MKIPSIEKYKAIKEDAKACATPWRDYAKKVCDDFHITGPWKAMIFRHAKQNLSYLQGRVENVREKFGDVSDKGRYLVSLFRSKKPWE